MGQPGDAGGQRRIGAVRIGSGVASQRHCTRTRRLGAASAGIVQPWACRGADGDRRDCALHQAGSAGFGSPFAQPMGAMGPGCVSRGSDGAGRDDDGSLLRLASRRMARGLSRSDLPTRRLKTNRWIAKCGKQGIFPIVGNFRGPEFVELLDFSALLLFQVGDHFVGSAPTASV